MTFRRWIRVGSPPARSGAHTCGTAARPARRWLTGAALCACLLSPAPASAQDDRVVHEVQSQYQLITVLDTATGYRQLVFDGRFDGTDPIQSQMNLADPYELTLSYARHMITAVAVPDRPRRILIVGLGGACLQRYLRKLLPEATIETAEIDPAMRAIAVKYFFFKEDARQIVHVGDGRTFIERSKDRYDLILLDAFTATSIPYHLTTLEFLRAVAMRLGGGGVVGANLWDAEPNYWDLVKTYSAVFPGLHIVKCAGSANSILLAIPTKTDFTVQAWAGRAAAFERARPTGLDLPQLILTGAAQALSIPATARVLLDKDAGGGW